MFVGAEAGASSKQDGSETFIQGNWLIDLTGPVPTAMVVKWNRPVFDRIRIGSFDKNKTKIPSKYKT